MSRSGIQSAVPQQVNQALQVAGDQNLKRRQIDNAAMANAATAKNQAERTQAMLRGQDISAANDAADREARFAREQIALKESQKTREMQDLLARDQMAAQQEMNAERIALAEEEMKLKEKLKTEEMNLIIQQQDLDAKLALAEVKDRDALIAQKEETASRLADLRRKESQIKVDQGEVNELFGDTTIGLKEDVENVIVNYDGYDETIANNLLPTSLKATASPEMGIGASLVSSAEGLFGADATEEQIAEFISDPAKATSYLVNSFANSVLKIANSSDETTNGNIEALSRRLMRDLITKGEADPYIFIRAEKAGIDPMMLQQAAHTFALQMAEASNKYAALKSFTSEEVLKDGRSMIPGLEGELVGMSVQDAAVLKSVFNQLNATNLVKGTKSYFNVNAVRTQLDAMDAANTDSVLDTFKDIYELTDQDDLDLTFIRDVAGQLDLTQQQLLNLLEEESELEAQSAFDIANPSKQNQADVYRKLLEGRDNE